MGGGRCEADARDRLSSNAMKTKASARVTSFVFSGNANFESRSSTPVR
jgi:hypothetical protein